MIVRTRLRGGLPRRSGRRRSSHVQHREEKSVKDHDAQRIMGRSGGVGGGWMGRVLLGFGLATALGVVACRDVAEPSADPPRSPRPRRPGRGRCVHQSADGRLKRHPLGHRSRVRRPRPLRPPEPSRSLPALPFLPLVGLPQPPPQRMDRLICLASSRGERALARRTTAVWHGQLPSCRIPTLAARRGQTGRG